MSKENVSSEKMMGERRERLMVLRCIIREKGHKYYIGECLELGIVTQGKSDRECKRNLFEAMEAYAEAARDSKNDRIVVRKIPLYPLRKILFDFRYKFNSWKSNKKDKFFIEKRSVPVGI